MTVPHLTKQDKDLILTFMSTILEFDKENDLLEEGYFKLFKENMYRLINLIAKTTFDSINDDIDLHIQELFEDVSLFNQNEQIKKKKVNNDCQLNHRIQSY